MFKKIREERRKIALISQRSLSGRSCRSGAGPAHRLSFAMLITRLKRLRIVELPLRNPNFGLYSVGSAISLIGMWMQRIAIGWLTWQLTGSGFWLGVVSFADFFPVVVVGPIAGAAADRWDRLKAVQVSQALSLLQASVLFWLTATGRITIELLVALTAFQGVVVAFNQPARLVLVPSLVPHADLATAVAINSVVFNLARFIGPACAGPLIVWTGVSGAFAANALSYLPFLAVLARIRIKASEEIPPKRSNMISELKEGSLHSLPSRHRSAARVVNGARRGREATQ